MRTQTMLTTLVLLFFLCSAGFAQQPDRPSKTRKNQPNVNSNPQQINLETGSSGAYNETGLPGSKGSAYLNPKFIKSVMIFKDGTRIEGKQMRFNLYTQQMQFIEEGDTLALGNPEEIEIIRIGDKAFLYTRFIENREHKSGYFELLKNGDCRLLKHWTALYHEIDDQESSFDYGFYRDCNCYLQFFMNPATPVNKKRKDLALSFASNGEEVLDYMKDEKLKPNNDADLVKIVEYYNSLQ